MLQVGDQGSDSPTQHTWLVFPFNAIMTGLDRHFRCGGAIVRSVSLPFAKGHRRMKWVSFWYNKVPFRSKDDDTGKEMK
ncbi:hypothetical protein N7509_012341 [Penicillium cosmopolitanum]|uniref:Uncharacterized protein n=1 Tax=Penicillium cosmopolitanum TaxID=1131564 RepID=A0A9W9SIQ5_9EURO|nr:uncharacterized protein N7509_012341 [Penicillium cosmopolitanum]KAJ5379222.1 hypothetical protein N7509_012341 [Penicillium cosmopolitanum]